MINIVKSTDAGLLLIRLFMGLAMASHGYAKIFGGNMAQMVDGVGSMGFPLPVVFAWAAALSEFAGGLLIAAGCMTRAAALFVLITMCVAFFIVHANDPFKVKELAYLYGAVSLGLIFTGAGRFSLDSKCCKHQ